MKKRLANLFLVICLLACFGDAIITAVVGSFYPGYSHLSDTLSQMGSDISPVAFIMSSWWVILGLTFVLLGIILAQVPSIPNKHFKIASWLLIGYGVGEGISSGLFPVSYTQTENDVISMLHIALSGIGVLSILLLPLILQRFFDRKKFHSFYMFSYSVVGFGLLFIGSFSLAKSIDNPQNFFVIYKGLWQRLLSLCFYSYLVALSLLMFNYNKVTNKEIKNSKINV